MRKNYRGLMSGFWSNMFFKSLSRISAFTVLVLASTFLVSSSAMATTTAVLTTIGNQLSFADRGTSIAVSQNDGFVFVSNPTENKVQEINHSSGAVVREWQLPFETIPSGIAFNNVTNKLFVSSALHKLIFTIDINSGSIISAPSVSSIHTPSVNEVTNKVYLGGSDSNGNSAVTVLDANNNSSSNLAMTLGSEERIAINQNTNTLYIPTGFNIKVLNGSDNSLLATVSVGISVIKTLAVNNKTNRIYAVTADGKIIVLDGATNTVTQTVDAGQGFRDVIVREASNEIFISSLDNSIYVFNGVTNTVTDRITGISSAYLLSLQLSSNTLFITPDLWSSGVTGFRSALALTSSPQAPVISNPTLPVPVYKTRYAQKVIAWGDPTISFSVSSGTLPTGLSLNQTSGLISGSAISPGSFSFTVTATNSLGTSSLSYTWAISNYQISNFGTSFTTSAADMQVDSSTGNVFVSYQGALQKVSVLSATGEPISSWATGSESYPRALGLIQSSGNVYVTSVTPPYLGLTPRSMVFNNQFTEIATFPFEAYEVLVNQTTNRAYFATALTLEVVNTSTNTVIASIQTGENALRIDIDPLSKRIFVPQKVSKVIKVINSETGEILPDINLGAISATARPESVAVDSALSRLYIADSALNKIWVFNSATSEYITQISVGLYPIDLVSDQSNHKLYVANHVQSLYSATQTSSSISVIDGNTNTVSQTISTALQPKILQLSPDSKRLYILPKGSSTVASNQLSFITFQDPPALPTVTTTALTSGTFNQSYSASVVTTGDPTIAYSVSAGSLPAGLSLNSASGSITGTPSSSGISSFTITATNDFGSDSKALTITIAPTVPEAPTGVSATPGGQQAAVSWTAPSNTGGAAITGYTVTSSPGGVTVNSSGVATTASVSGLAAGTVYTFSVTATTSAGTSVSSAASAAITTLGASSISVSGTNSFIYSGQPQGPDSVVKSGSTGLVTFTYVGVGGTTYGPSSVKPSDEGTYSVTATVGSDSGYAGATSGTFAFQILTPGAVSVTYDSRGGTVVSQSSFVHGTTFILASSPTRPGYTFTGWFTSISGGVALTSSYAPGYVSNVTLYAQWEALSTNTLRFFAPNGSGTPTDLENQVTGTSVTLPSAIPTRTGYTFSGWSLAGAIHQAGSSFTVLPGVTLFTASWSEISAPVVTQRPSNSLQRAIAPPRVQAPLNSSSLQSNGELFIKAKLPVPTVSAKSLPPAVVSEIKSIAKQVKEGSSASLVIPVTGSETSSLKEINAQVKLLVAQVAATGLSVSVNTEFIDGKVVKTVTARPAIGLIAAVPKIQLFEGSSTKLSSLAKNELKNLSEKVFTNNSSLLSVQIVLSDQVSLKSAKAQAKVVTKLLKSQGLVVSTKTKKIDGVKTVVVTAKRKK